MMTVGEFTSLIENEEIEVDVYEEKNEKRKRILTIKAKYTPYIKDEVLNRKIEGINIESLRDHVWIRIKLEGDDKR